MSDLSNHRFIENITIEQFQKLQEECNKNNKVIIVKFRATWCAPCRRIATFVDAIVKTLPEHFIYIDNDIDETMDLYMKLKAKKMLKGIPSILAWFPNKDRLHWYINDESVSGTDHNDIKHFFDICISENKK